MMDLNNRLEAFSSRLRLEDAVTSSGDVSSAIGRFITVKDEVAACRTSWMKRIVELKRLH